MLLAGDESGRTQEGNNNSYCQDNSISWMDWKRVNANKELIEFCKKLIQLRAKSPILKKGAFFDGHNIRGTEIRDLVWYLPDGDEMTHENWEDSELKSFGLIMALEDCTKSGENEKFIIENSLMILLNASSETVNFSVPNSNITSSWEVVINTSYDTLTTEDLHYSTNNAIKMIEKTLVVLKPAIGKASQ